MSPEVITQDGVRQAMGDEAYAAMRQRVIDHAVDVMVLGGALVPVSAEPGFMPGHEIRYPVALAHEIATAAVVRATAILRSPRP